ncbi:hypothetical protein AB2553_29405 [Bacillus mycoides]|uniref:hypothetical protein n=1 Tax=Bacillus mycoides TaxID=1405 RepID=UPI003463D657
MRELYDQFEREFKEYIQDTAWVHDYGSKHFANLVAISVLQEEKVADDDTDKKHILIERFYFSEPDGFNVCQVKDIFDDYYINKGEPGLILERTYTTLKFLYGYEISYPKIKWKFTSEFVDVYMYC